MFSVVAYPSGAALRTADIIQENSIFSWASGLLFSSNFYRALCWCMALWTRLCTSVQHGVSLSFLLLSHLNLLWELNLVLVFSYHHPQHSFWNFVKYTHKQTNQQKAPSPCKCGRNVESTIQPRLKFSEARKHGKGVSCLKKKDKKRKESGNHCDIRLNRCKSWRAEGAERSAHPALRPLGYAIIPNGTVASQTVRHLAQLQFDIHQSTKLILVSDIPVRLADECMFSLKRLTLLESIKGMRNKISAENILPTLCLKNKQRENPPWRVSVCHRRQRLELGLQTVNKGFYTSVTLWPVIAFMVLRSNQISCFRTESIPAWGRNLSSAIHRWPQVTNEEVHYVKPPSEASPIIACWYLTVFSQNVEELLIKG